MTNNLEKRQITSPGEWEQVLQRLPDPHVLQSWEWGALKERQGWQVSCWLWHVAGEPQAAALLLLRQAGRLPVRVAYVPKGPLLDYGDAPLLVQVLADLEDLARRERALFVKIDPDVPLDLPPGQQVVERLRRRGWQPSREQVQFRNTMLLDLTPDLDDIMAGFKSKWRYNVRLAARKGVQVQEGGSDDLPLLYRMYEETSQRNRFVIRPEAYYRDAWGSFIQAGRAQPLIATVSGEPVAMVILFCYGQRAWYMYGASRPAHRELMPNHLLQWEAIRWAKERGCTVYDLWGAPEVLEEADPMWGVYRFKQGFGAELARYIGAYDFPTARLAYWLYTVGAPRLLAWMRWRHWRHSRDEPPTWS
ncbi:MAG: peptidoglycan bridge formation glycyltransferase FemA/FemB family protein [Anaerolineae bacterium]|nr:peptidoglycan bridge formation glycyltransferase FemA/FemB family protein [Anaerolineae bacterium]